MSKALWSEKIIIKKRAIVAMKFLIVAAIALVPLIYIYFSVHSLEVVGISIFLIGIVGLFYLVNKVYRKGNDYEVKILPQGIYNGNDKKNELLVWDQIESISVNAQQIPDFMLWSDTLKATKEDIYNNSGLTQIILKAKTINLGYPAWMINLPTANKEKFKTRIFSLQNGKSFINTLIKLGKGDLIQTL
ncbi:MAG: hypothetical protein V1768_02525 [Patescibacteria group bacterium]|nr:hypothetical protein [Patescibacteria group bacterium]MBU1421259.1 hypothetical protein [Patescibacteria group bacterium]MBU2416257.1 hypothetical protein [Patescibacteria group bacterium]MBU2456431.1 hypothetical protein [Patescibacteria group bacterium]